MRRKRVPRSLRSVISDVVGEFGIEGKLQEGRIIATWQDIVGERIGREVERVWVKNRKLIVRIKSPVWRQELHLNRRSWTDRLNAELGSELVDEIVFR